MEQNKKNSLIERYKYPLLALAVGLLLMLLPGSADNKTLISGDDAIVAELLSCARGVGDAKVLISDKGVVVVCEGADKAKVRLEIISAVNSYTGYSSDKITILKMQN